MNGVPISTIYAPAALSLEIALIATILALITGGGLAWFFSGRRSLIATIFEGIITLPLVLPPVVLGFYLLLTLGQTGGVGQFITRILKVNLIFTPAAAVIAATVAALPIMYKAVKAFLEVVDPEVIKAAQLDGASRFKVLIFMEIPLAARGVFTGILLSFLRALGEFGATLMVAGNIPGRTQTLSLAIWGSVMGGDLVRAHILTAVLAGICLLVVFSMRFFDMERKSSV
ncbi:MAG: molybdate ABC transporter permease subunit [Firmicutes bacterium]|nr:molybdate ABC transporter permease subunit [Bacillota bacterium]